MAEIGIEGKYIITAVSTGKTAEPPSNVNCNITSRLLIAFGSNAYPRGKTVAENTANLTFLEVGFSARRCMSSNICRWRRGSHVIRKIKIKCVDGNRIKQYGGV
jgi:hypothetical protein